MNKVKQQKWDDCYKNADIATAAAATILKNNAHLLPSTAHALDVACGRAGNAQFLANKGFTVDAFDFSPNVIAALKHFVPDSINPQLWNSESDTLRQAHYDVIVVSYFLQRDLFPALIAALKEGGLLFYQTWSQQCVDSSGPSNPDFRLQRGELLSLCTDLRIVYYREEGKLGDIRLGSRNDAYLIAEKC
ncbi:MAG TPA: methyltransferase domain-containing protein [Leucothrix mucor]|nr:methyltransferase domain-containing protein [Leucothrix mucor]